MTTATRPLQAGDQIAGRYRLVAVVPSEPDSISTLWQAYDEVLARQVALRVVPIPNKAAREQAEPFLSAAVLSSQVNHPGLARVYDAAVTTDRGRGAEVAYLIREWVDGQPLDEHLEQVGTLAALDAADVLRQAADALTAAHAAGLVHARVHPRNVLVTPAGRVRLTDAAVGAALRGAAPGPVTPVLVAADTRDLAAVLYSLLTGRWPRGATAQPGGSLREAPRGGSNPFAPRQLLASVPRQLDSVVLRGLDGSHPQQLTTPAALADAADSAVAETRQALVEQSQPSKPSRVRRLLPWTVAGVVIAGVGLVGWLLGIAVGTLEPRNGSVNAIVTTTDAPTPGVAAARPLDLSKVVLRDFDPEGDGQENPDKIRNAVDDFPDTTWPTSRYRSASFSGLKSGVGLLLDLGTVRPLSTVQVGFSAPGAQVELRVADAAATAAPATAAGFRTVAAARDGKQVATLKPLVGTRARFVLVWITSLPKEDGGYRVGISELRLT